MSSDLSSLAPTHSPTNYPALNLTMTCCSYACYAQINVQMQETFTEKTWTWTQSTLLANNQIWFFLLCFTFINFFSYFFEKYFLNHENEIANLPIIEFFCKISRRTRVSNLNIRFRHCSRFACSKVVLLAYANLETIYFWKRKFLLFFVLSKHFKCRFSIFFVIRVVQSPFDKKKKRCDDVKYAKTYFIDNKFTKMDQQNGKKP